MGVSENVVSTPKATGFADHYPYEKWLAIIGNINPTFSDKPIWFKKHYHILMIRYGAACWHAPPSAPLDSVGSGGLCTVAIDPFTRPGKRLHNYGKSPPIFNGKTHSKWPCSIAIR